MANFDIVYRIATDLTGLKKGVDDTAAATTNIDKKMTGLQSSVASAGKALLGAFAAQQVGSAILSLSNQVIDFAGSLVDMSAKTGISIRGLQLLKVAAEQNGVSLDQVAGAANKLGINLAGGGKDVTTAVQKLGLSLADLKKGAPEDNLFKIAKAMDGIENPAERAKVAMSLFGKAGVELLPILNGQFSESARAAERLGIVMGDDVVEKVDVFGDQMTVVKASLMKAVAEGLAPMLPALLAVADMAVKASTGAIAFGRAIVDNMVGAVLKAKEVFFGFAYVIADIALSVPGLAKLFGTTQPEALEKLKAKTKEAGDAYRIFKEDTAKAAGAVDNHSAKTQKALPALEDWGDGNKKAADAAREHAKAIETLVDHLATYTRVSSGTFIEANKRYWTDIHKFADLQGEKIVDVQLKTFGLQRQMAEWDRQASSQTALLDNLKDIGTAITELPPVITQVGAILQNKLKDTFAKIPATLQQAFTGGGGVGGAIKAIGSMIGEGIGSSVLESLSAKASQNIGGALDKFLKSGLGQVVSSAIPVIGSLIGPAIQGLGRLFGFGESAAEKALKQAKQLRDEFVRSAGGMKELEARAASAGVTLLTVLNARTPEAYKKAIDDLNDAFAFQDSAMQTLDETVKKYGFSLAELPETLRRGQLHEQFLELYKDQQILRAGGFEFDAVLQKQKDSFIQLVKTSIETGTAIPIQLKPSIDRLKEMGLLVDENGTELEGLGKLTFAETLDQKFGTLIDTINRLAEAIERGVGGALANAAANADDFTRAIRDIPEPGGAGDSGSYGYRGGVVTGRGIRYMDKGGPIGPFIPRGLDTVPAMLSVGEGVLSRDGMKALGALNRGHAPGNVVSMNAFLAAQERTNAALAGLRRDLATTIPTMVGLAARHGDQTRGRKRG